MKELERRINNLNDLSDQKEVSEIKKSIEWMNYNDPEVRKIVKLLENKLN